MPQPILPASVVLRPLVAGRNRIRAGGAFPPLIIQTDTGGATNTLEIHDNNDLSIFTINQVGSFNVIRRTNNASAAALNFFRDRLAATVQINDPLASITANPYDGASYLQTAYMQFLVDAAVSSGVVPTAWKLLTGTNGTPTERLRVSSDGVFTTATGRVRKLRVVTAAGAVTVATTDDIVVVKKTSGAATVVNLPATPTTGQTFVIQDGKGDAATNNLTITPAAGNINGAATLVINTNYGSVVVAYDGTQWEAQVQGAASGSTVYTTINVVIDGGGSVLTTGIKCDLSIDFACTIVSATLLADQSGSVVIDVWKDTYANYPPVDADSITASAPPTISSAVKSQDASLTGWTKAIAAGDTLRFNVDSATTIQRVTLALKVSVP